MATLIAKAGARRLEQAHAELDLLDDDDGLEPSTALTAVEPEIDLLADIGRLWLEDKRSRFDCGDQQGLA